MQELVDAIIAQIQTTGHTPYDTDVPGTAAMPRTVVTAPTFPEEHTTGAGPADLHSYMQVKYVGLTAAQVRLVTVDVREALKEPFDVGDWRVWVRLTGEGQAYPDGDHLEPSTAARVIAATDTYSVDATRK